jgi:hypothetical protein
MANLIGRAAANAGLPPPLAAGWLVEHGWRLSGPVCPDCVAEASR